GAGSALVDVVINAAELPDPEAEIIVGVVEVIRNRLALAGLHVHLEGRAELANGGEAFGGAGGTAGLAEDGEQDRNQQGDDADDDEELDESEGSFGFGGHGYISDFWRRCCQTISGERKGNF